MMIVGREIRFSASHRLPNVPDGHKCSRLHGHSYRVAVEVSGPVDATLGWVADFGVVDSALRTIVYDVLDHRHLNDIAGLENPTSEVLAGWCMERLSLFLPHLQIVSVTVHEGDGGGWARLEGVG
jgi:6-pyruvoyltetrahydropterin/6-carboxytetrahydropterin synthase